MKKVLTKEQINHLEELGLNVKELSSVVSDSFYNISDSSNFIVIGNSKVYCDPITGGSVENIDLYYTLTFQDLLNILPKCITNGNDEWYLFLDFCNSVISYSDDINFSFINRIDIVDNNYIDSAYDMLCWCIENDYIKL